MKTKKFLNASTFRSTDLNENYRIIAVELYYLFKEVEFSIYDRPDFQESLEEKINRLLEEYKWFGTFETDYEDEIGYTLESTLPFDSHEISFFSSLNKQGDPSISIRAQQKQVSGVAGMGL